MNNEKRITFQEIAERVDDLIDMADYTSLIIPTVSGIIQD